MMHPEDYPTTPAYRAAWPQIAHLQEGLQWDVTLFRLTSSERDPDPPWRLTCEDLRLERPHRFSFHLRHDSIDWLVTQATRIIERLKDDGTW